MLLCAPASPASTRVIRAAARPVPASVLPALPLGSLIPGAGLAGIPMTAPLNLGPALPLPALPALKAPALSPALSLSRTAALSPRAGSAVPQALLRKVARTAPLRAAIDRDSSPGEKSAALAAVFDGDGSIHSDGARAGGLSGIAADTFQNGFGFYRWISELPEIASLTSRPELAKARALLAAAPLLELGAVIAMKDGASLTILSVKDPAAPPAVVSLAEVSADAATPRELMLERRLEEAVAADKAQRTFVNVAGLLNKLPDIAREEPAPAEEKPGIVSGEMPLDPQRQPKEYVGRILRDAMRSDDPYETLEILQRARKEAKQRLNYQDRARFLGQLRGQAELRAGHFLPGLLESAQLAAADNDKDSVRTILDAAFEFTEYAPGWKERVQQAARTAHDTMDLLDRFGPIDEETGLPVQEEDADPETPE